jgi:hypothetical protein
MKMKGKRVLLLCLAGALAFSGCVTKNVEFSGKSVIDSDGNVNRSGKLKIVLSGEREVEKDLSLALNYYHENFEAPDEAVFAVQQTFDDGVLTVTWNGDLARTEFPFSDYTHRSKTGHQAGNSITLEMKNRWFFRDWTYTEVFSDPVDTAGIFPVLDERMSAASERVLDLDSMKGLRDRRGAEALLRTIETETGVNLLRSFLENPRAEDSLANLQQSKLASVADSLAGFAGVKLDPDSLTQLLSSVYSAVWDTLLTDHPGILGSYGMEEPDRHNFEIEVKYPGCLLVSNADSMVQAACIWSFDRLDFFAREKKLEIKYRIWSWGNVIIAAAIILVLMVFLLISLRKKRA